MSTAPIANNITIRKIAEYAADLASGDASARVHEVGGNNLGPEVEFYQRTTGGQPGESWCADLIYAKLLKAHCFLHKLLTGQTDAENQAIMLAHADAFSALYHVPRTGSCAVVAAAATTQRRFQPRTFTPVLGDLVLFDMPVKGQQLGRAHHIGFVIRQEGSMLHTVEGNTSSGVVGSQGDGDGVFLRMRAKTYVYGFVHW